MALVKNIGAIGLGITLSQFPEYSQQYVQRLGGAVEELKTVTNQFDNTAKRNGETRETALETMVGSTFWEDRKDDMIQTIERGEKLESEYTKLKDANAYKRLANIYNFFDPQIAKSTWSDFKAAIPLNVESLVLLLGGYIGFYGVFTGLGRFLRGRRSQRRIKSGDRFERLSN